MRLKGRDRFLRATPSSAQELSKTQRLSETTYVQSQAEIPAFSIPMEHVNSISSEIEGTREATRREQDQACFSWGRNFCLDRVSDDICVNPAA